MHQKKIKLLEALSTYDLTKIIHNYDKTTINSLFHGTPILTKFTNDCLLKISNHKPSYLTKFLNIYPKLIELGANPNLTDETNGKTTLHEVIEFGTNHVNTLVLKKILEYSDVNKSDYKDLTTLGYSLKYDNSLACDLILNFPNFKINKNVILNTAQYCNDLNIIVKIFSMNEFDYTKIKTIEGHNLLHICIMNSNSLLVPILIDLGINPIEKNLFNKSAFEYSPEFIENIPILKKYINYCLLNNHLKTHNVKEKVKKI